jgi:molecular chaperone GrpE
MKIKKQHPHLVPNLNPGSSIIKTTVEEIRKSNASIEDQLSKLRELYIDKIQVDELKNKQFEIMVEELQRYKTNFIYDTIQKKIFQELIGINDRIEDFLKVNIDSISRDEIIQYVSSFRNQILQILNSQGVEQLQVKGNKFDPKFQEAVAVVSADIPEQDLEIEEISQQGFIYDNKKILRPQKVVVKRYSNQIKKEVQNG